MPEQPTPQQTFDQRRARNAMEVVDAVMKDLSQEEAKKFGGQARKLPMRIIASGLGQALVFLKAKGTTPRLLTALGDWVLTIVKPSEQVRRQLGEPDEALLNAVILGSATYLRQATDEALVYLQWLNRFCEANKLTDDTET